MHLDAPERSGYRPRLRNHKIMIIVSGQRMLTKEGGSPPLRFSISPKGILYDKSMKVSILTIRMVLKKKLDVDTLNKIILQIGIIISIILFIITTGCLDDSEEEPEKMDKYGIQIIEISVNITDESEYILIVPIAGPGEKENPIVNSNFTLLNGNATYSISPTEYGNGLLIKSNESISIKAEANEYRAITPTMLTKEGRWFFLNCSNSVIISYSLYSFTSVHSSTNHFWMDNLELQNGWNFVDLNVEMVTE